MFQIDRLGCLLEQANAEVGRLVYGFAVRLQPAVANAENEATAHHALEIDAILYLGVRRRDHARKLYLTGGEGTTLAGFAEPAEEKATQLPECVEAKTARVDSALAKALGASDLEPEKSRNISVGFTYKPLPQANLTLDAYQIEIKDRIGLTGFLFGGGVNQILQQQGLTPGYRVKYFTNAADTTTRGVDLVTDYKVDYGRYGSVKYGVAFNYNKTDLDSIKSTPGVLASSGLELFDRVAQGYLTVANPKTKLILSGNWKIDKFDINASVNRYDKVIARDANPAYDVTYGAKWITDLEVAYAVTDSLGVAVGANNLFDVRADNNGYPNGDINGFPKFGSISPFDPYGGLWYTRVSYNF